MKRFCVFLLFITAIILSINCKGKESAARQLIGTTQSISNSVSLDSAEGEKRIAPQTRINYGGAEEVSNDEMKASILRFENPYLGGEIRHLYKTNLSGSVNYLYIALLTGLYDTDNIWRLLVYTIHDNRVIRRSPFTLSTMSGYKELDHYNWLRYRSKIPGDWIECGFVGDFNEDKKYELLIFAATGMGLFMQIYEYDEGSDNFRETFEEEFTMLSSKPVQYGELNGERGFIITYYDDDKYKPESPDVIQRAFFAWDGSKREYVFKGEYTGKIE
jgi:hypothetical protein